MKGQWVGTYSNTEDITNVDGNIVINIDEEKEKYKGIAYITPLLQNLPSFAAHFHFPITNQVESTAYINAVNPNTKFQCDFSDISHMYPDVSMADKADYTLEYQHNTLKINAVADNGVELHAVIDEPNISKWSTIQGQTVTWDGFKKELSRRSKTRYLYRGQKKHWRLSTTYHRAGRYHISSFTEKDIPMLHRRISGMTNHFFNLSDPQQNGAFFNLVQHHGYPTPLLDWTRSPYVAAYFAFKDWKKGYNGDDSVRIFVLNEEAWSDTYQQISNLNPAILHLSISEFIALENPRSVPQQSVTTATNIDNIESYLLHRQEIDGSTYIEAFDIPARFRDEVLNELQFMGITAGALFPSIEGVCEELKENLF